jgi:hypothetical protein
VVEPADLRQGIGAALLGRFDGTRLRSILSEREVRYALRRIDVWFRRAFAEARIKWSPL